MAGNLNLNDSLESLLNKATNPLNRSDDWEFIMDFCDRANYELEGYYTALKLLLHKIKSPQPKEALQALTVLETCVKNCNEQFHKLLGKKEYIAELENMVLDMNYGKPCDHKVKQKLIHLLYAWGIALPDQPHIKAAYQKIKIKGCILKDPDVDASSYVSRASDSKSNQYFTDQEKKVQLEKLLRSKNKSDLQTANLLIQSAVQADEVKMEKGALRLATLEEVDNSVKLLRDMISQYNGASAKSEDRDAIKELYDNCQRLRPVLYRMASEVADGDADDEMIVDIFASSDKLSRVIDSYETLPQSTSKENMTKSPDPVESNDQTSSDLLDLTESSVSVVKPPESLPSSSNVSLLDDVFGSCSSTLASVSVTSSKDLDLLDFGSPSSNVPYNLPSSITPKPISKPTDHGASDNQSDLSFLLSDLNRPSKKISEVDLLSLNPIEKDTETKPMLPPVDLLSLNDRNNVDDMSDTHLIDLSGDKLTHLMSKPKFEPPVPINQTPDLLLSDSSLDDIFVPLQSIIPSTVSPVTVYDTNGIRILLHFAKNRPTPYRTDILVCVVSIMSTRTDTVQNILFQVAAPTIMKVKLQAPSCTELAPFNPIFSTPPLTQVMLIANPTKKDVTLRYKFDYKLGDQNTVMESGIIRGFPSPSRWGNL